MKPPTRRLIIVGQPWENVAPDVGSSISIVACELARCLSEKWDVTIYGRRWRGQRQVEMSNDKVKFERFIIYHKHQRILEKILSVLACWNKTRFSYVFSYFYHPFYFLRAALSIRRSKCDAVLVVNFLQLAAIIRFFNPSATICLRMGCEWLTDFATPANQRRLRKVDLIVTVSDYITDTIRTRFPEIAARCHTIHNGVDVEAFSPAQGGSTQGDGVQRLLYVGRLLPEKGIHVLIRAFSILAENHPTLRLDLVGPADRGLYLYLCPDLKDRAVACLVKAFYGDRFSEMVRKQLTRRWSYLDTLASLAGGDERIVFHGGVRQAETIDFYRRAAMLVFPSVWNEPSGNPTVEAAACGLPVISTYSGGIPEYVDDGRTGILVARGDAGELARAMGQLIDDPALRRSMGEAGRQRVLERFTWKTSARRLAELIESVRRKPSQNQPSPLPSA